MAIMSAPVITGVMQVMRQITHIGQQHVVSHVGSNCQTNTCQQAACFGNLERDSEPSSDLRGRLVFQFIDMLLERRSRQRMAQ